MVLPLEALHSNSIVEELLRDTVDTISTTPFCLLVMEPMETLELTTGFSRTLGELLGVKMVTLELREPQRNTQLEHAEFISTTLIQLSLLLLNEVTKIHFTEKN